MEYFYQGKLLPFYLAALAVGIVVWFIQRKDRQKVFMPLLRVLELPDRQVRRWNLVMPPLVPLLVSLALMGLVLFASFGPFQQATVLSRSPAQKVMMVVDLSPSVQASTALANYRELLKANYSKLRRKTAVVWLDSFRMEPQTFSNDAAMSAYVDSLGFHPWGVNLDTLLTHAQNYGDHSILVFSDRDQNAWQNFTQQLSSDRNVWWYDLGPSEVRDNIYIDSVAIKDDPDPAYINLEYRLSRTSGLDYRQVGVALRPHDAASDSGQVQRQTVSFAANRRSITSSLALSRSDWAAEDNAILALTIEAKDSIALDNTHLVSLGAGSRKALLISHQGGEKFIDSPVFSTVQSLKSLGFEVDMAYGLPPRDKGLAKGQAPQPLPYELVVVIGFTDRFFKDLCKHSPLDRLRPKTPLWVVDLSLNRQEKLASSNCRSLFPKVAQAAPAALRRNGYSELSPRMALPTYTQKRKQSKTRLVIIRDLMELQEVNYRLNVMFYYDLWQRSQLNQGHSGREEVVAIRDGSSRSPAQLASLPLQNVPRVESRLQTINEELLPAVFSMDQITDSGLRQKKHIPDSTTVFRLLLLGLVVLTLIEVTYRWQRNKLGHYLVWFVLGCGLALASRPAHAEVAMGFYKLPFAIDEARYAALAKYVQTRTSLVMPRVPFRSEQFDAELLSKPMVIAGRGALANLSKSQQRMLQRWLLAGGILIADHLADRGPLVTITNDLVIQGIWQDVSLDNELMRSFHLLTSLPSCQGVTFSEFRLENRIAILTVPFSISSLLLADNPDAGCMGSMPDREFFSKLFINILMTALTTDYKKDQIHLPEILKKLR